MKMIIQDPETGMRVGQVTEGTSKLLVGIE